MAFPGLLTGPLIGVVHLLPLPGSPGFRGSSRGGMQKVLARAIEDARAYENGGMDAVIVENFGDVPFPKCDLPKSSIAALTLAVDAVERAVNIPIGVNALRNDAMAALGIAAATGAAFVRINVHAGVVATDQGIIEGDAAGTIRERARLQCRVAIAADVAVKHGRALHSTDIAAAAADLVLRAEADAVIVTGAATGSAVDLEELRAVRAAIGRSQCLIAGSGVNNGNVRDILEVADGVIVGTALKRGGRTRNPVDSARVKSFVRESCSS